MVLFALFVLKMLLVATLTLGCMVFFVHLIPSVRSLISSAAEVYSYIRSGDIEVGIDNSMSAKKIAWSMFGILYSFLELWIAYFFLIKFSSFILKMGG